MRYLALIRGINVGGRNLVKMPELRRAFESLGCTDVSTYIQSGNVLFQEKTRNTRALPAAIEAALASEFHASFPVVVLSARQLETVVTRRPAGFGADTARYRYDVVFLKPPARAASILPSISLREEVDDASERNGVLYLRKLIARASQSRLPRLTQHPDYRSMTIRNWRTTMELLRLMSTAPG